MALGDHVFVLRLGFTHHGIDAGDGSVIHYTGEVFQKENPVIQRTLVDDFMKGSPIQIRFYGRCDEPSVTVERAISRLGEAEYHVLFKNCEHFATWCKTGQAKSEQVKDAAATSGGVVATGAAVAAGLGTVSATGIAGLSGSGIMSGLATVGSTVGLGATAGIALVGAAPAAVTSAVMMYFLKDDAELPATEREARTMGRRATLAAAVGGPIASVGAVSAAGSVAGLGATGITSGLSAIGATVGGNMAAGVLITAGAPAIAAAALGYGSYRLWKAWRLRQAAETSEKPNDEPPGTGDGGL